MPSTGSNSWDVLAEGNVTLLLRDPAINMWTVAEAGRQFIGRVVKNCKKDASSPSRFSIHALDATTKELLIDYLLTTSTTYTPTRPLIVYLSSDLLETLTASPMRARQIHQNNKAVMSGISRHHLLVATATTAACPSHIGLSFACPRTFASFDEAIRLAITSSNGTIGCPSTATIAEANSNGESSTSANSDSEDNNYLLFCQSHQQELSSGRRFKASNDSLRRHRFSRHGRESHPVPTTITEQPPASSVASLATQKPGESDKSKTEQSKSELDLKLASSGSKSTVQQNHYEYAKPSQSYPSLSGKKQFENEDGSTKKQQKTQKKKLKEKTGGLFSSRSRTSNSQSTGSGKTNGLFRITALEPTQRPPLPVSQTAVNNNYEPAPTRNAGGGIFWPTKSSNDDVLKKPMAIPGPSLPQMSKPHKFSGIFACFPFSHSPRHHNLKQQQQRDDSEPVYITRRSCPGENNNLSTDGLNKFAKNNNQKTALAGLNNVISPTLASKNDNYVSMEHGSGNLSSRTPSRSCPTSLVAEIMLSSN